MTVDGENTSRRCARMSSGFHSRTSGDTQTTSGFTPTTVGDTQTTSGFPQTTSRFWFEHRRPTSPPVGSASSTRGCARPPRRFTPSPDCVPRTASSSASAPGRTDVSSRRPAHMWVGAPATLVDAALILWGCRVISTLKGRSDSRPSRFATAFPTTGGSWAPGQGGEVTGAD
jgi:hypothetical protein